MRARGALTESGIVEHWRLTGGTKRVRPAVDGLVADGLLERLDVDDGGARVLVAAGTDLDPPAPTAAVLLSPFDNLLWDRPFARRVLGFDHLIEIYKREHERRYGYYVLPFLRGDRIVARLDVKSERAEQATRRPSCAPGAPGPPLRCVRRRSRPRARPVAAGGRTRARATHVAVRTRVRARLRRDASTITRS